MKAVERFSGAVRPIATFSFEPANFHQHVERSVWKALVAATSHLQATILAKEYCPLPICFLRQSESSVKAAALYAAVATTTVGVLLWENERTDTARCEEAAVDAAPSVIIGPATSEGEVDVPLPVDKLACHRPPPGKPRAEQHVVLVTAGSFNPPTFMHLRLLELARDAVQRQGGDVLGAYMTPVNGAYGKQARQGSYQRTLTVLRHIEHDVNAALQPLEQQRSCAEAEAEAQLARARVRVMLVCGADLLESFAAPGVWIPQQVEEILGAFGVVCISRDGCDVRELIASNATLRKHQAHILVVDNPITNDVSASKVRSCFAQGLSVKYLLPDLVIEYAKENNLYTKEAELYSHRL
eukprot:jgi/Mesen1/7156/ME000037S06516